MGRKKKVFETSMWRTSPGHFRIQTNDGKLTVKLNVRKGMTRCMWGITEYVSGFSFGPCTAVEAVKVLKRSTGLKIKKNSRKEIWEAIPA